MRHPLALLAVVAVGALGASSASASTPPGSNPLGSAPSGEGAVECAAPVDDTSMSAPGDATSSGLVGFWCVASIGATPVGGVVANVRFGADGRVSGLGGVNDFSGEYRDTGETIEFSPLVSTLMAGPEPAMQVEAGLLGVLHDAQPYSIDGDVLTIGSGDLTVTLVRPGSGATEDGSGAAVVTVSGTVTYLERMALPEGALLTVRISNVSPADAPAGAIAEAVITPMHEVPLPYAIAVSPSDFEEGQTYSLLAQITVGDDLLFTTTEHLPVTPTPAAQTIDLVLSRAGG